MSKATNNVDIIRNKRGRSPIVLSLMFTGDHRDSAAAMFYEHMWIAEFQTRLRRSKTGEAVYVQSIVYQSHTEAGSEKVNAFVDSVARLIYSLAPCNIESSLWTPSEYLERVNRLALEYEMGRELAEIFDISLGLEPPGPEEMND